MRVTLPPAQKEGGPLPMIEADSGEGQAGQMAVATPPDVAGIGTEKLLPGTIFTFGRGTVAATVTGVETAVTGFV